MCLFLFLLFQFGENMKRILHWDRRGGVTDGVHGIENDVRGEGDESGEVTGSVQGGKQKREKK